MESLHVSLDNLLEETTLLSSKFLERDKEYEVSKIVKYESAEDFRKSPPDTDIVQLDLSVCKDLTDDDLAEKRHRYPLLEMLDVSGCEKLTGKGLPKFLQKNPRCRKVAVGGNQRQLDFSHVKELSLYIQFSQWDSAVIKCPSLEKLHLKCKGEVDSIKLLVLLWQVSRHSPKCVELNVHLTPDVFKKQAKEIPATIAHALPYCTFCLIEYDDEEKKVDEKKLQQMQEAISTITTAPPSSYAYDILEGFYAGNFTDISITVKDQQTISAHSVILEHRCPILLTQKHFPDVHINTFKSFMSFLYSDILPLPSNSNEKYNVTIPSLQELQELNKLAIKFQVPRLQAICVLLVSTLGDGPGDISLLDAIPPSTLASDISQAFGKKSSHDVSIIAKERDFPNNNKRIKLEKVITASRFILSSRCPYFGRLFESGMKDSNINCLEINEISSETLNLVIHYLYTDQAKFEPEFVCEMYIIADMMHLCGLKEKCVQNVKDNINLNNTILIAKQSYLFSADEIGNIAFDFFTKNAESLYQKEEIQELEWPLLRVFLAYTYNYLLEEHNDENNTARLQCQILKSILRWSMERCKSQKEEEENINLTEIGQKSIFNHIDMPSLRKKLELILKYMNTLRLSSVDFAHCLVDSGIFPKQMVWDTFSGLGVVLEDDSCETNMNILSIHNWSKTSTLPICSKCGDWGYLKISVPCSCYHTGIFCGWCHNTGSTHKIGNPCNYCDRGQVIKLKFLFDKKLLEECIRTPMEANSVERSREMLSKFFVQGEEDIL